MKQRIVGIADKISEYSLYGLLISIPFSKASIEICATLAILAFILKKICMTQVRFLKDRLNFFLLLFMVFNGLSLFNSGPYLKDSLDTLFSKWLEYILLFLVAQDTLTSERRLKNAITLLLIGGIIAGFDGLLQWIFGIEAIRQRPMILIKEGTYALTGPFNYYNTFAAYLVVILALLMEKFCSTFKIIKQPGVGQSETKKRFMYKSAYLFFLALAIIMLQLCLFFTFSRGAWAGFFMAMLLMLLLIKKRKFMLLAILIFVMGIIFVSTIRERIMFTFLPEGDKGRFTMWKGAWEMISENPLLGKGLGTFMKYSPKYIKDIGITYAHNCYLQIWAESGLFSLISFFSFILLLLWEGIRAFKKSQDYILLGLISGIFGFLVHSFLDVHLYSLQLAVLFWVLSGALVATINLANNLITNGEKMR